MKSFNKIIGLLILIIIAVAIFSNLALHYEKSERGRPYLVEVSRIEREIKEKGFSETDFSNYHYVTGVFVFEGDDGFYNSGSDYVIREINGKIYRFDYTSETKNEKSTFIVLNGTLFIMAVLLIGSGLYVRNKIILPFEQLSNVPYELSKGNLAIPLKENKNRFFGRFIWGVDLLRENMQEQKERELELLKNKKTLLLSLSHDIKTPLSAIKLYSKALSKGLYESKEKQLEIAECINEKADEIEGFVSDIVTASREDFMSFEVNEGEFYLSSLINKISAFYKEKLSLVKTDFTVGEYEDCLLKGDIDRAVEVLQNVIENATKYGDGKTISLYAMEDEGCMLLTVKNSGNTLEEEDINHIFESFWRGANAKNEKGSGLGLYICRQLMQKMNGEIFAEIKEGFTFVTAVFNKA